jgi:hypothetical protein
VSIKVTGRPVLHLHIKQSLATFVLCSGLLPAEIYWTILERISSHGYVVIGIWSLTELPTSQIKPEWLKVVNDWLQVSECLVLIQK